MLEQGPEPEDQPTLTSFGDAKIAIQEGENYVYVHMQAHKCIQEKKNQAFLQ